MYKEKYIKYKTKYTALKKQLGGDVINYKGDIINIIYNFEIIINREAIRDGYEDMYDNTNLKLIISYKPNSIRICLGNTVRGNPLWDIILSDNSFITLNKNLKSTEIVNQIKFFIAWINSQRRQVQLYNTINNYLEIFESLYTQRTFNIVTNIDKHVELLNSVKTKITELIKETNGKNDETFKKDREAAWTVFSKSPYVDYGDDD